MTPTPFNDKLAWPRLGLGMMILATLAVLLWGASQLQLVKDLRAQRLVQTAAQMDNPARARNTLRRALALAPYSAPARNALAQLELAQNRLEAAYLELRTLAELHPKDPRGWTGLSGFFLSANLLEDAERVLDKAVLAAPNDPVLRVQRGDVRLRRGRLHAAWLDAGAAVELSPEQIGGWLILIRTTEQMHGRTASRDIANKALSLHTQEERLRAEMRRLEGPPSEHPYQAGRPPVEAQYNKLRQLHARRASKNADERWGGRLAALRRSLEQHLRAQDWDGAQALVSSARTEFPHTLFGPWLAGIVALAQNQDAQAEQYLLEALQQAPRSELVLNGLVKTWRRQFGARLSAEKLAALYTADPAFQAALSLAVDAYLSARQPAAAAELLLRARKLDRHSAHPYQQQAQYYLLTDQLSAAAASLDEGLAHFSDDRELLHLRARLLNAGGPSAAATAAYARLVTAHPDAQFAQAEYALLLTHDPETHTQARLIAEQLAFNHPTDPALQDMIGWILLRTGANEPALPWLQAAVAIDPAQPRYHYHLAECQQRLGAREAAREQVRLALEAEQPFAQEVDALRLLRSLEDFPPTHTQGAQ